MSTPSTLGTSVPRSAHTNLDLMRDFGFIKEYVKGLGVIGTHVRMCRGATPCHSYVFVPLFGVILSGIRTIRTAIRAYSFLVRAIRTPRPSGSAGDGRAAGDTPTRGLSYALRSRATRCSTLRAPLPTRLGTLREYSATYSVGYGLSRSDSLRRWSARERSGARARPLGEREYLRRLPEEEIVVPCEYRYEYPVSTP